MEAGRLCQWMTHMPEQPIDDLRDVMWFLTAVACLGWAQGLLNISDYGDGRDWMRLSKRRP